MTRLPDLDLPQCGFALDKGCFRGLSAEEPERYVIRPGRAWELFSPFEIEHVERDEGRNEKLPLVLDAA